MTPHTCQECRHFSDEPQELQRLVSGLRILSSAYSVVRADYGFRARRDIIQRPVPACVEFEPATPSPPR